MMRSRWLAWLIVSAACGSETTHALPTGHDGGVDAAPRVDAATTDAAPIAVVDASVGAPFRMIRVPTGAVGYVTASGSATSIVFNNSGRHAQCRVGHVPEVEETNYRDCPAADANGDITIALSTDDAGAVWRTQGRTDGAYRVFIAYTDEHGEKPVFQADFYLHRTLDRAATCPIKPATWPTDQAFFTEAVKPFSAPIARPPSWYVKGSGALPQTNAFPPGDALAPPFLQLGFTKVTLGAYLRLGELDADLHPSEVDLSDQTQDVTLKAWSLRHRITLNADRTLAIVQRTYESRGAAKVGSTGVCGMSTPFGASNNIALFTCDAIVLNASGEGFCMSVDATGPHQAVFAEQMIAKLMKHALGDEFPHSNDGSVWGPKVYSPVTDELPDDQIEVLGIERHPSARAVLLRP